MNLKQKSIMNKSIWFKTLFGIALGSFALVTSCTHDAVLPDVYKSDTPITIGSGFCSPDTMYYNRDIAPILLSSCATSGCHNSTSAADGVDLTSYSKVIQTGGVRPYNPSNSELIEVLYDNGEDRMPPSPSTRLSSDLIAKIELWINQGALNLTCSDTSACDSVNITFSQHVSPILSVNCVGCHSGGSPGGGIDLSNYTNIKAQVDNGKLIGSIEARTGFVAMPPGGNSLNSCNIAQINIWVADGAPNN